MADFGRYFLVGVLLYILVPNTGGVDVAILNQYPSVESNRVTVLTCITNGTVQGTNNFDDYYFKVQFPLGVTEFTDQVGTGTFPSLSVPNKVTVTTTTSGSDGVIGVFSCSARMDSVTNEVFTIKIRSAACVKPLSYTIHAREGESMTVPVETSTGCQVNRDIKLLRTDGTQVAQVYASERGQTYTLKYTAISQGDSGIYGVTYDDIGHHLTSYVRLIVDDPTCPRLCYHGGRCDNDGICICPPGFYGDNCQFACESSDKYGQSCQWSCNDGNPVRTCRRSLICLPDPYGCECANGFKGFDCNTGCDSNEYGPGCTNQCNHCANGGTCDVNKGCLCTADWRGPTCQEKKFRIALSTPSVLISDALVTTATVACSCHPWTTDDCPEVVASVRGNEVALASQSNWNGREAVWTFIPPQRLGQMQVDCSVTYSGIYYTYPAVINITGMGPSIVFNPPDVEVNIGQSVILTCGADGDPEPIRTDFTLTKSDNTVTHQADSALSNATAIFSTFEFNQVSHDLDGEFMCHVRTIAGVVSSLPITIAVKVPPSPRNKPIMVEVGLDFIFVNINSRPHNGDGPLEKTTLRYRQLPEGQWQTIDIPTGQSQVNLTGLMQDTEYNITVVLTRPGPGGSGSDGPSNIIRTAAPAAGPSLGLIAGAAGGSAVLILVLVAVAIFIFWRRRRRKESSRAPPASVPISQLPTNRPKSEEDTCTHGDDAADERNRSPTVADAPAVVASPRPVTYGPVPLDQLVAYVKKQHANSDVGFKAEYKALRDGQLHPWDVARQVYNKKKNRYGNIVTYDHSRVVIGCDPSSDYINASYIKGYKKEKMYIAAQGPNKATIADLWRMAWQEKSPCIVMVTNLMENNKIKCERYWPDNTTTEQYGDFGVTCMREDVQTDFIMRKFHLFQADDPKIFHELYQYQFTVWPDHGVPTYASPLMALRNRVKEHVTPESGPIIVHCSAGVGRTGTFIMLDMMMEMFKEEEQVDVFNCVNELREQRINMVQTSDQYIFIYDALLEAIVCGDTAVPSDQFRAKFQILRQKPRSGGPSELMIQFIALRSLTPIVNPKECRDGRAAENKNKNRRSDDLPSDRARPFLMSPGDEAGTNYINAAFINGYKQRDVYIATQAPLPNTILDMWRLVYDYRISTVVMLNDMDGGDPTCPRYWPDPKQSVQHGMFLVDHVDDTQDGHLITRTLKLQNTVKNTEAARTVKIFQLTGWPRDQKTPPSPCQAAMITLLSEVERWQQQTGNEPIVVHCIDGVERSGVFCALGVACERVKVEQVVDIFQAVKTVRACRPTMVNDVAAYECCHQLVIEYLKGFDTYANFA